MSRKTWIVDATVSHPTNYFVGVIEVTVVSNGTSVYCTANGMGCSRDYAVADPKTAVTTFLREHGCSVTRIGIVQSKNRLVNYKRLRAMGKPAAVAWWIAGCFAKFHRLYDTDFAYYGRHLSLNSEKILSVKID